MAINLDIKKQKLIGCNSLDRYFAALFDSLPATILAIFAAVKLSPYGVVASWTGLCLVYFGYFLLLEILLGNTPGKWCMGLCVRTMYGDPCSCGQMSIRNLFRVMEVNPLLFGALPAAIAILLSGSRQRLGDLVAGTVVIRRARISGSALGDMR
jgi:uncharacterized RDD family membrane protein YckC